MRSRLAIALGSLMFGACAAGASEARETLHTSNFLVTAPAVAAAPAIKARGSAEIATFERRPEIAQAPQNESLSEALARRAPRGVTATLLFENDAFDVIGQLSPTGTTDRFYTNGMLASLVSKSEPSEAFKLPKRLAGLFMGPVRDVRWAATLGQNIYTPENIRLAEPDPRDRPYAGWAYLGGAVAVYGPQQMTLLELQLGVVGPSAAAEWVQGSWHDEVLEIPRAQGWRHQLNDEFAFVIFGERRWVSEPHTVAPALFPGLGSVDVDLTRRAAVALGTVQVSGSVGFDLRVGQGLGTDYGPPRIRPSLAGTSFFNPPRTGFGWYAFAGVEARAVGRDIFLDGNTWTDSPRVRKHNVVLEAQAGVAAVFCHRFRVAYSHVVRSEEFRGQGEYFRFGTVSFSMLFGDWRGGFPANLCRAP